MSNYNLKIKTVTLALVTTTMSALSSGVFAGDISIESWRVDDKDLWQSEVIPAFQKKYPEINVKFSPTSPSEYNASLNTRLAGGTAGDLITCRPFDVSLELYNKGYLMDVSAEPGMEHFPEVAKSAWSTDDGKTSFCMPMASVIHGFFYNKEIFSELNLKAPNTVDEFFNVVETIKSESRYTPIALGTNDGWETHQIVYTNIGPNYWKGEEGRKGLVDGSLKASDDAFIAPYEQMAKWKDYLSRGFQAQTYSDSQNLFSLGRAAIYPAGSWDIAFFAGNAEFEFGAFKPPVQQQGDTCYISDHTDIGMGINPKSSNPEDAKTFLNWLGSKEFAELYSNKVTGFFSLSNHDITINNPVAAEMISWRSECESTIRLNAKIINRGRDDLETSFWNAGASVINHSASAQAMGQKIQSILDK